MHNINLDESVIFELATDAAVMERGYAYYKEDRVTRFKLEGGRDGEVLSAQVLGSKRKVYNIEVGFDERGDIEYYYCGCDAATIWRGACKHIVAALFDVIETLGGELKNNIYDTAKTNLIKHFRERAQQGIEAQFPSGEEALNDLAGQVSITPKIQIVSANGESPPYVSLSVGITRSYVIKNVYSFMRNIEQGKFVRYGKQLGFRHDMSAFDNRSKRLIEMVSRFFASLEDASDVSGGYTMRISQSLERIPMVGWLADEVFDIYQDGVSVIIPYAKDKRQFFVAKTEYVPKISIVDEGTKIILEDKTGKYVRVQGKTQDYIIDNNGIAPVTAELADDFERIRLNIKRSGAERLELEGSEAEAFREYAIPLLTRGGMGARRQTEKLDTQNDTQKMRMYLDTEGRDVTCRLDIDGTPLSLEGDGYKQLWAKAFLKFYGLEQDKNKESTYILRDDDRIFEFVNSGLRVAVANAEVFASESFNNFKPKAESRPSLGVRLGGELLEVEFSMGGYTLEEMLEALNSYRTAKRYFRLKDGSYLDLQDDGVSATVSMMDRMNVSKRDIKNGVLSLPTYRAHELDDLGSFNTTYDESIKGLISSLRSARRYDPPESLRASLREYQLDGYSWLRMLTEYGLGGVLADDMGLGKTIQMICLLLAHKESSDEDARSEGVGSKIRAWAVVVAPTSLVYNWEAEIARFAPSLSTTVVVGTATKRAEEVFAEADVIITTYDSLKRDIEHYEGARFEFVVADEAQHMKNHSTKNATAVKSLEGRCRFALTGTPIENTLSEMWSIFDFALPGILHSHTRFVKLYEAPIVKGENEEAKASLKKRITPFILRRKKEDVLTELPDKSTTIIFSGMTKPQELLYKSKLMEAKGLLSEMVEAKRTSNDKLEILSMIMRLRQICAHPSLFLEDYSGGSGKLEGLTEMLQNILSGGHRVLLFSQFTSMLGLIRNELTQRGIPSYYLDGSTKAKERQEMVDKFNGGSRDVFLISLRAGGLGLNLVGADVVIHYDQWWNPAVMSQATDRAHRFGQTKNVQVFNLIAKDSIEENIIRLQERKQALVDTMLEGNAAANTLSEDDLKEIFGVS